MNDSKTGTSDWAASNIRNTVRLRYWTIAWVLSSALAAFGPKLIWNFHAGLTILGVVITLAFGFGMIVANKRYVQGLDEMHRKIFLDAGALSLGVGLVCGLSYELLEDIKLITFEPEISHLVILMCLTFFTGLIMGHRKYQ
jgi:hypothetical protein